MNKSQLFEKHKDNPKIVKKKKTNNQMKNKLLKEMRIFVK